ncbi:hypothetical protein F5887DRAFT_950985 [Amanita rubescens]|nr:hypothetical protein F5887DRAFT_950985 [Amanita rubescens]
MNYLTFVNGLRAYVIMMFFLGFLGFCLARTHQIFQLEWEKLTIILLSPLITALCLLIYQLQVSSLWLYTLS